VGERSPTKAEKQQAVFERYSADVLKRGWLETAVVDIRLDVNFLVEEYKPRAWKAYFFVLSSSSSINVFSDEKCNSLKGTIALTPDAIISGTNLAEHSFQVTCPGSCLHARCANEEDTQSWVDCFTRAARASTSLTHLPDKIMQEAKASATVPETYQANYPVKSALGFNVKRRGDWAVISAVDDQSHSDNEITVGSVLYSINNKPVLLESYEETIQSLKSWTPPMTLRFFHPPSYRGPLSLCRNQNSKRAQRYLFVLEDGVLTWQKAVDESTARLSLSFTRRPSRASLTRKSPTRRSEAPASGDFATLEDDTIAVDDLTSIDGTRRHSKERNLADGLDFEKLGGKLTAVQTGKNKPAAAQASASSGPTAGEVGGGTVRAVVGAPAVVDRPPSAKPGLSKEYSFISMLAANQEGGAGDVSDTPRLSDASSTGRMSSESVLGFNGKEERIRGFVRLEGGCLRVLPSRGSGDLHRFELTTAVGSYVFQADNEDELCVWCATLYNALSIANGGGFLLRTERNNQQAP
jgi:hypothetical protein